MAARKVNRIERDLDEHDRLILRALQQDARLTLSQIAERVGLSQTPCWNRLKRLESAGVIDRYVAVLCNEKLGYPETIIIEVTLDRHEEDILEKFGDAVRKLPEVIEVYLTAGGYDYLIKVAVAGTAHFEQFLREKLYRIGGIRQTRSIFTLRCLKRQPSIQM